VRWSEEKLAEHLAKQGKDGFSDLVKSKGDNPREDVEHLAVAGYLNLLGICWQHSANEGKRSPREGAKLKALGLQPGFPDILILDAPPLHPCVKGAAIEMKRQRGGKVSDDQRKWLANLEQRGWLCMVAEGANEAIEWLRSMGWRIEKGGINAE